MTHKSDLGRRSPLQVSALVVLVAAGVLLCLAACSKGTPNTGSDPTPATSTPGTSTQSPSVPGEIQPGIRLIGNGRVQALGIVRHIEIEGGFWALTKASAEPNSSQEEVVVVVVNAEDVGLPTYEGGRVAVNGKLNEGASIRMAGPEMTADEVIVPH